MLEVLSNRTKSLFPSKSDFLAAGISTTLMKDLWLLITRRGIFRLSLQSRMKKIANFVAPYAQFNLKIKLIKVKDHSTALKLEFSLKCLRAENVSTLLRWLYIEERFES